MEHLGGSGGELPGNKQQPSLVSEKLSETALDAFDLHALEFWPEEEALGLRVEGMQGNDGFPPLLPAQQAPQAPHQHPGPAYLNTGPHHVQQAMAMHPPGVAARASVPGMAPPEYSSFNTTSFTEYSMPNHQSLGLRPSITGSEMPGESIGPQSMVVGHPSMLQGYVSLGPSTSLGGAPGVPGQLLYAQPKMLDPAGAFCRSLIVLWHLIYFCPVLEQLRALF
jgi:hypothetical protein